MAEVTTSTPAPAAAEPAPAPAPDPVEGLKGTPAPAVAPAPAPEPAPKAKEPEPPRQPNGEFAKRPWSDQIKDIADEPARKWGERFNSLEDMAKAGLEFRKAASQREGWVKVPGEDAPEDEVKTWRAANGIPDTPEAYGVTLAPEMMADDASKDRFGRFLATMHGAGASRQAVAKVAEWYQSEIRAVAQAQEKALADEMAKGETELRRAWSTDYDRNAAIAERAATWAGGPELAQLLKDIGIEKHPIVMRTMARIGAQLAPHVPVIGEPAEQIVSTLDAIQAEGRKRMDDGTYGDKDYQDRRRRAFEAAYPGTQQAA